MTAAQLSAQPESIVALQALRRISHSATHIANVTCRLDRLAGLKKGSIDAITCSLNEISVSLQQLQTTESQQALIHCRQTEVGAK